MADDLRTRATREGEDLKRRKQKRLDIVRHDRNALRQAVADQTGVLDKYVLVLSSGALSWLVHFVQQKSVASNQKHIEWLSFLVGGDYAPRSGINHPVLFYITSACFVLSICATLFGYWSSTQLCEQQIYIYDGELLDNQDDEREKRKLRAYNSITSLANFVGRFGLGVGIVGLMTFFLFNHSV